MTNYLGYNPAEQTKSDHFGHYLSYNNTYIKTHNDYELPNHGHTTFTNKDPRYEFTKYSFPTNDFSAENLKHYKHQLNPKGAEQVEFKANELYGYSELLK